MAIEIDEEGAQRSPGRWLGLLGGPVVAGALYLVLGAAGDESGLSESGCRVAAVAALMGIWWLTEAIPLAATALLPLVLWPLLRIMPIGDAAAPFANEVIFLFLGGFLLQIALERWGLHRRIALIVILAVGTRPARLVGGIMLATAILSMWISNTASSAMMVPIGMSVCRLVAGRGPGGEPLEVPTHPMRQVRNLGVCVMIGIAWSATIGGLTTPIGSPPNVLLRGFMRDRFGLTVSFAEWMALCVPLGVSLLAGGWWLLVRWMYPVRAAGEPGAGDAPSQRGALLDELRGLGRVKPGEWATMSVFSLAVLGWLLGAPLCRATGLVFENARGVETPVLTDSVVAMIAALLLFLIPVNVRRQEFVLDWRSASRVPYGVLLLFGGGLSLARGIERAGLDTAIGQALQGAAALPTVVMLLVIVAACVLLSEFMSNTALAAALLPIVAGVAGAMGAEPLLLLLPVALGASCPFMMPAGTPPNAIAFSSGYFTIRQMARAGLVMDIAAIGAITLAVSTGAPRVMSLPGPAAPERPVIQQAWKNAVMNSAMSSGSTLPSPLKSARGSVPPKK